MGREATGTPGTWRKGSPQLTAALRTLGVPTQSGVRQDGFGLSSRDTVTTDQVTALLLAARGQPWFAAEYAALPVAGMPGHLVGGTLADRFAGTPAQGRVHAKTGTLDTVSALSGYALTTTGRRLAFSLIGNSRFDLTDVIDRAVVIIVRSGAADMPGKANG